MRKKNDKLGATFLVGSVEGSRDLPFVQDVFEMNRHPFGKFKSIPNWIVQMFTHHLHHFIQQEEQSIIAHLHLGNHVLVDAFIGIFRRLLQELDHGSNVRPA